MYGPVFTTSHADDLSDLLGTVRMSDLISYELNEFYPKKTYRMHFWYCKGVLVLRFLLFGFFKASMVFVI